jgi:hypothetical protein
MTTKKSPDASSKPAELKDKALDAAQGASATASTSTTEKGFWDGYAGIFSGKGGWAGKK